MVAAAVVVNNDLILGQGNLSGSYNCSRVLIILMVAVQLHRLHAFLNVRGSLIVGQAGYGDFAQDGGDVTVGHRHDPGPVGGIFTGTYSLFKGT